MIKELDKLCDNNDKSVIIMHILWQQLKSPAWLGWSEGCSLRMLMNIEERTHPVNYINKQSTNLQLVKSTNGPQVTGTPYVKDILHVGLLANLYKTIMTKNNTCSWIWKESISFTTYSFSLNEYTHF